MYLKLHNSLGAIVFDDSAVTLFANDNDYLCGRLWIWCWEYGNSIPGNKKLLEF